VLNIICN